MTSLKLSKQTVIDRWSGCSESLSSFVALTGQHRRRERGGGGGERRRRRTRFDRRPRHVAQPFARAHCRQIVALRRVDDEQATHEFARQRRFKLRRYVSAVDVGDGFQRRKRRIKYK